ncbi:FtsQ-type POTRA domain-containing protein [Rathayibacter sp. YIM 133350]|uniref:FtsQ-type POTRA domain-containing protein n=1 Tax=Rathayibacter sp. YIM 133350 TaxID=3131992 RepID=UPI00307F35D7
MKRPNGFERPPAPELPRQRPSSRPRDEAITAPVAVIEHPAPELDETDRRDTAPPEPRGPRVGLRSAASAAAAEVRRAAKARRRYERAEVRRFTVTSRRRRRNVLIGIGAVLGMAAIVAAVAFSPVTALRVIQVEGANRVAPTAIVDALDDEIGTPLALIDQDAVHRKLAAFSLIQSYTTEAHPPGTLVVRIIEREPIGLEKTASGFDLVDSAGIVISSSAERPAGFPVLSATSPTALAASGEVVRALPADIRGQLDTITAATHDDVTLTLTNGRTVVWGSADDSVLKAAVFGRLLGVAPDASRYDVSSPTSPVYS